MIEFNGYLTDKAKDFYLTDCVKTKRTVLLVLFLAVLPAMVFNSLLLFKNPIILILYLIIAAVFIILPGIKSNSAKNLKTLPNKVYCSGAEVTSVSDNVTVTKSVNEAKTVIDYGDFYIIKFAGFKTDEKFICQKSLLAGGSLEEFEKLFADKIKRK